MTLKEMQAAFRARLHAAADADGTITFADWRSAMGCDSDPATCRAAWADATQRMAYRNGARKNGLIPSE